jgi:hypothetical protein
MATAGPSLTTREDTMGEIFCGSCGSKLDESPTLVPDQRQPCSNCGSVARRFVQEFTGGIVYDGETPSSEETVAVGRDLTLSGNVQAHAQTAEMAVTAFDATVEIGPNERGTRVIKDHLVIARRFIRWTQLTRKPGAAWFVEVLDESGEMIDSGAGDSQDDALLAVIDSLRPPDPA